MAQIIVNSRTVRIAGRPIYPIFSQFMVACFTGALVTDIVYWKSADLMWSTFSSWLLAVGVILGFIAVIIDLVDFFADSVIRRAGVARTFIVVEVLAYILAVFNLFVHSRDGWTAVIPSGLTLSIVVFLLLLINAWIGWPGSYYYSLGDSQ